MFDEPEMYATAVSNDDREQFGRNFEFVVFVDHFFPDQWRKTRPTAENVLTVIEQFLEYGDADPEERFDQACRRAASALGKREDTIRRSCGRRLYDSQIGREYSDQFIEDLVEFEERWNEFRTG